MADAGFIELEIGAAPSAPATGFVRIYEDTLGLKVKDESGAVIDLGGSGSSTAAGVSFVPSGSVVASNVQAAIEELDSEKAPAAHVGSKGVLQHAVADATDAGFMSPSDFTKLAGIANGATANDTDANLKNRANHTGTQAASTISDFSTAADARVNLHAGLTDNPHSVTKAQVGLGSVDNTADTAKPVSVAQAAADAAIQAYSIQRGNHTGTQTASTISDFNSAADARCAANSAPLSHVGAGGSAHAQVVAGVSDGFMLAADKTKLDALPTGASLTSSLAAKANKAGDTFTGEIVVEGNGLNTGTVNLKSQNDPVPTPASGVRIYADTNERFAVKGQSGFSAILDEQSLTEDRTYTLPDADGSILMDPTTTNGDLIKRDGSTLQRIPIGQEDDILRVVGGVPAWEPENLTQDFGDGSDLDLTVTGALTLNQIPYYNRLTIEAGAVINPNGYPIYCKILDLTNAPAGAIVRNGNNGNNGLNSATGQAGGAALNANILGASGAGSTGAAGAANAGVASAAATTINSSNGGSGGANGASGAGGTGAAVAQQGGASANTPTHFGRFEYQFLRGAVAVSGGAGGRGGNSGGGDGANTSRGAPGGGGGAGIIVIYAAEIITGPSTPAGVIQCRGGNGGSQTFASTGSTGGASGAGGGGGGYCYLTFVKKTGPTVNGLVNCSGGNGGNGGPGAGTGIGGNGGTGGTGGYIQTYNVTTGLGVQVTGTAGNNGTAASGTTGGIGGNGGTCLLNL